MRLTDEDRMDAMRRGELDQVQFDRTRVPHITTHQHKEHIMKLRTATVAYEYEDGLANFSNHSASIVLNFELEEDDLENLPGLKSRIRHAQRIAEEAVTESIERTRPDPDPDPGPDCDGGDGDGGYDDDRRPVRPPSRAIAPPSRAIAPPSPPTAPPPPSGNAGHAHGNGNGNGNGQGKQYGPPKTVKQFLGWLRNQPKDVSARARALAEAWGFPTLFSQWNDADIVHLYHQLTAVPAVVPPWGGHPADGNGNGAYGRGGH